MQRLLLVDDNPHDGALLGAALSQEGYQVSRARDGAEALRMLERERPDVILTDLIMPGVDDLSLCRALRANPRHGNASIVALTGGEYPEELSGLCDVFLRKPVDVDRLIDTLQQLEASRMLDALPLAGHGLRW